MVSEDELEIKFRDVGKEEEVDCVDDDDRGTEEKLVIVSIVSVDVSKVVESVLLTVEEVPGMD
jgi:hypothetical protein